jgi:hypothetical protein
MYKIKRISRLTGKTGFYLDSVFPAGHVFDSRPDYVCCELNMDSGEFEYSIVKA